MPRSGEKSTQGLIDSKSKIDLSHAGLILERYSEDEINQNPLLRLLKGDAAETIISSFSPDDIKKYYLDLAKVFHPDKNPTTDSQEANRINNMFILIADAYIKLNQGGQKDLPVAIDLGILEEGYDYLVPYQTFYTKDWSLTHGSWDDFFTWGMASRSTTSERNLNPNLSDYELVVAYGCRTFQAHEWTRLFVSYLAFRDIDDRLDMDLTNWVPVNRSVRDQGLISTSIKRGWEGGLFLCPTALAPQYQEIEKGKLKDIFEIYPGESLIKLPRDIVAVNDPGYDLSHIVGDEIMIQPWTYINQNTLDRLVKLYYSRYLKDESTTRGFLGRGSPAEPGVV